MPWVLGVAGNQEGDLSSQIGARGQVSKELHEPSLIGKYRCQKCNEAKAKAKA